MSSARPDGESAEPILLTEAALERVLDAFLPEDPDEAEAAARSRADAAQAADDLFVSEQPGEAAHDAALVLSRPAMTLAGETFAEPIPVEKTDVGPLWRTYKSPGGSGTAIVVPRKADTQRGGRVSRVAVWAAAAAAAIVLAVASAQFMPGSRTRAPDAIADRVAEALPQPAPAPVIAPGAANGVNGAPAAATRSAASPNRDASPVVIPRTPAGAVLKGTLTPQSVQVRPAPRTKAPVAEPARPVVRPARPIDPPVRPSDPPPAASPVAPASARPGAPSASSVPEPAVPPPPSAPPPARVAEPTPVLTVEPTAPPAPAPPAPVPAPAPAATPLPPTDATNIEGVLGRYRQAYGALDAGAARSIWPTVDVRALGRAFDQLEQQQLEFQTCKIAVNGVRATAACGGRARYVPKVGSKAVRDEPRQWTFNLRKVQDAWVIERVASR